MAIDTNLAYSLGAGSGVDTKSLAKSLVEAEQVPRQQAIEAKIKTSESKISGLGAMSMILSTLKTEFEKLNETSDFNSFATYNSAESAFSVSTTSAADPVSHTVEVLSLASPQRTVSSGFATATTTVNGGSAFSLGVSLNGASSVSLRIPSSKTTPQGIVDTINASDVGFTAKLLNTGDGSAAPYKIVLVGEVGADNAFTVTTDDASSGVGATREITFGAATAAGTITVAGVAVTLAAGDSAATVASKVKATLEADTFITNVAGRSISVSGAIVTLAYAASDGTPPATTVSAAATGVTSAVVQTINPVSGASVTGLSFGTNLQNASDAHARIDGLDVYRTSNTIADVITGVTLDLRTTTSTAATLGINRDPTPIKEKVNGLIEAYNSAISDFAVLMGEKNKDDPEDIYSGSLAGDSTARLILAQIKGMIIGTSDSASNGVNALRDIGVDIARDGTLSLNESKFNTAVTDQFSDVVTMLSADSTVQSLSGDVSRGVAGAAVKKITDLLKSGNDLLAQSENAKKRITKYEADLETLNTRMEALLLRYTRQFAMMDSIVGQISQTRDGLKSQFEALANMYKK